MEISAPRCPAVPEPPGWRPPKPERLAQLHRDRALAAGSSRLRGLRDGSASRGPIGLWPGASLGRRSARHAWFVPRLYTTPGVAAERVGEGGLIQGRNGPSGFSAGAPRFSFRKIRKWGPERKLGKRGSLQLELGSPWTPLSPPGVRRDVGPQAAYTSPYLAPPSPPQAWIEGLGHLTPLCATHYSISEFLEDFSFLFINWGGRRSQASQVLSRSSCPARLALGKARSRPAWRTGNHPPRCIE